VTWPELFDLPDGADQVAVLDADPPESERDRAIRAAAMCPALAIKVS
jgi:ferredoxin